MPVKQYFLWVGSALLGLMLMLNAYLPKSQLHGEYDLDRTILRVSAPDTGIAPDTGATAIGASPVKDEARDPETESKVLARPTATTQAFAKLQVSAPKKHQGKARARAGPAAPANAAVSAQSMMSSHGSYDWSWNQTWRGPVTDASRSNARRQASTQTNRHPAAGNWTFNFSGSGRSGTCWGC